MSVRHAILLGAYAIAAILTYGHSAAEEDRYIKLHCATSTQRTEEPGLRCYSSPSFDGFGAAIFWPLYWSWELQQ